MKPSHSRKRARAMLNGSLIVLVVGLGFWSSAKASARSPKTKPLEILEDINMTRTAAGDMRGKAHIRAHVGNHTTFAACGLARAAEFVGPDGKVKKRIEVRNDYLDRKNRVMQIHMPKRGGHVGVVEDRSGPDEKGWKGKFRYYDEAGREIWTADYCCDSGAPDIAILSEDGSIVVLVDAGEGSGCIEGEGGRPAPSGCAAIRVYTAEGNEIFRATRGRDPEVSPLGKYILFYAANGWTVMETATRSLDHLPACPSDLGAVPAWVNDDGTLPYYNRGKLHCIYKFKTGFESGPLRQIQRH